MERILSARVDEELLKRLDKICESTGIRKKELVRRALKSYLEFLEQSDAIKFFSKE